MPDVALELEDLRVQYGAVAAVRGVSLTVGRGEIVGLVGPNGAGKSTTMLAIMGAVAVRAGDIRLDGHSIVGRPTERIVRSGVALVPEGRHIFAELTVEENLNLGLVGRSRRDGVGEDLARVRELFPVIKEFERRKAGLLSGGQQQQLAIARALLAAPSVLLLDEPSLGLAPSVVDTVFDAVSAIRDAGVTVLLVEQRAQITTRVCDRTYVLSNGEVRLELSRAEASDTERLVNAYFGS